jgi:hypothetical protein
MSYKLRGGLYFAKVVNVVSGGFVEANGVEFAGFTDGGNPRGQNFPDFDNEILTTCKFAPHKIYIQIEIFVIKFIGYLFAYQGAQFFQIDDKARFRVRIPFHGYNQLKIMPVPIFVGARAKYLLVLLHRPCWIKKFVGGVKMFFPTYVNHASNSLANIDTFYSLTIGPTEGVCWSATDKRTKAKKAKVKAGKSDGYRLILHTFSFTLDQNYVNCQKLIV